MGNMDISIAETHNRLSHLLKQLDDGPITITKHGQPVGVLLSPKEYEQLRRVRAYLQIVSLSHSLQESGLTARDLFESSRQELEGSE
jgi:prevent-host-death family protein